MVVGASLGRLVVCVLMASVLDDLVLFPIAFVSLILSKAHGVAKSALVPASVDDEGLLVEANAKLALVAVIAGFVSAVPAVAVLRLAGGAWVLRLGAVVFAGAAIAALRISSRPIGDETTAVPRDVGVRRHLSTAATAMAVLRGLTGFLTFLIAFELRRSGAPPWWFGLALAASMLGSLAGAVVAPPLRVRWREERILAASLLLVAVVGLGAARGAGRPAAVVLAAALGFAASAGKLSFDAIVQRDAADMARGRSFARFEAGFQLAWVAGAILPVVLVIPDRVGFFVVALGAALAALVFFVDRGPS